MMSLLSIPAVRKTIAGLAILAFIIGLVGAGVLMIERSKRQAVEAALIGFVAEAELAKMTAERDELRRRLEIEENINAALVEEARVADAALEAAEAQIRAEGETDEAPAVCTVGPELLDLLR